MSLRFLLVLLPALTLAVSCGGDDGPSPTTAATATLPLATASPAASAAIQTPETAFHLTSAAFTDGAPIPKQFSCDGENVSPPLEWSGAPAGTKAFALVMDDPDAPRGTFDHWVVSDIPAAATSLAAGASKSGLPRGSVDGKNGSGRNGYTGPCPPPGPAHHYHFRLLALDAPLGLPAGKSKAEVEQAAASHTLATAEIVGIFSR